MISLVSTCMGLVASVLLAFIHPVAGYCCFCKQTCEKYRQTDEAFTLNCADHRDDSECRRNCWFCKDMCTDHSSNKVYSCPENPDKKTDTGALVATIIWLAIVGGLLVVVVGGIVCSVFLSRNRRHAGVGVGGVAPMYPQMGQQGMYYPTMGTMSQSTMSYSHSHQQYQQTTSASSVSTSV